MLVAEATDTGKYVYWTQGYIGPVYTTAINLSKTKGAHNLRFGFEYDKYALNHFQPQGGTFGTARGTFGFDGTLTALIGSFADQTATQTDACSATGRQWNGASIHQCIPIAVGLGLGLHFSAGRREIKFDAIGNVSTARANDFGRVM